MKIFFVIFITLFSYHSVSAQDKNDLVYDMQYDVFRVGVDFSYDCIINKHFNNDTLFLTLFTQLPTDSFRFSVNFIDDTLSFDIIPDNISNKIIKYDSIQKITTHSLSISQQIGYETNYGFIIKLKLLAKIKTVNIKLNDQSIKQIIDKTSFQLIHHDTINKIDCLGMRQGLWVLYPNDTIAKIDSFFNDRRIASYNIDKNGYINSKIDEYGNQSLYIKRHSKKIRNQLLQNYVIKKSLNKN